MLVMTAKVDKKKIAIALAAVFLLVMALILLLGNADATTTAAPGLATNDGRVQFLQEFGWDVTNTPVESTQVKIPDEPSDVYDRYNTLQKSQGYDLSQYAGQTVMRYVYKIKNFPGATEPVYATLLIHKGQVIGGDVTDTAAKGAVQGFRMPKDATTPSTVAPTEDANATLPQDTAPTATQ